VGIGSPYFFFFAGAFFLAGAFFTGFFAGFLAAFFAGAFFFGGIVILPWVDVMET